MTWHCYQFEVNSIQRWIFGSGKLRAIIGGSRLVSGITDELLERILDVLPDEAGDRIEFARQAGGVFTALSEDEAALGELRRVWPLMVTRYAPGLSFGTGYGYGATVTAAMDKARADIGARGALPQAELPAAAPVMERSRRTGRAAIRIEDKEPADAITVAQLAAEQRGRDGAGSKDIGTRLAEKLGLAPDCWPRDMEPRENEGESSFPFLRDEPQAGDDKEKGTIINRYVALVHADGNGLGQIMRELRFSGGQEGIDERLRFSRALEDATFEACLHACRQVLLPYRAEDDRLPARPILLGGDDLSFIVRADLALHFTKVFLEAFEKETKQRLSGFNGISDEGLTACAGIAYLRSNQPFYMGMELAESLCGHAKKQIREFAGSAMFSALCQHRCTDSLISDWDSLIQNSLTIPNLNKEGKPFRLSMETWALHWGNEYGFPPIGALFDLLEFFEDPVIARGPARKLVGLVGTGPTLVAQKYRRWLEMLGKAEKDGMLKKRFHELIKVGVETKTHDDGPFLDWISHWATPIPEVLALKAMGATAEIKSYRAEEEAA